ncbi:MAG: ABC transporter permease [Bacteroidetes bacterium]|nr:MAG: ABC transporter permease [Bacteroidota bacterium]TAG91938.1 MAG: ABC transporter permease [Bacteroidota bacterium]
MLKYILNRLFYGFLVILGVVTVVFFLFFALPGDPAETLLGNKGNAEQRKQITQELGLDKPLALQYIYYLNDLSFMSIHSDSPKAQKDYQYLVLIRMNETVLVAKMPYLRRSYLSKKRVSEILYEDIGGTLVLALTAMFLASIIGVTLGVISALNARNWIDYSLITITVAGISTPSFVMAILMANIFAFYLSEYTGLRLTGTLWELDPQFGYRMALSNLILPAFTLALRPLAVITQLTRSSMLDVLTQDYIRTAKAKGIPKYVIIIKHALKNALNPVITAVSGWLATLMAGAFFIEYIFNWKGLGKTTIQAVQESDLPIVMGAVILVACIFVFVNIIVDVLYALLDPRVRLE